MKRILHIMVLLLGGFVGRADAQPCCPFGAYWPLEFGSLWKFTNTDFPFDIFFDAVLGPFPFDGNPTSVKVGRDIDNCFIGANDGVTFSVLGLVAKGVLTNPPGDLNLRDFSDGHLFMFDREENEFTVIRLWENIDHSLPGAGEYGVDQELEDVVLLVWYDMNFQSANSQNVIVESGGGQTYNYGVTDIDFLQKDVGPIAQVGVDAGSGDFDGRYGVVAFFDCWDCGTADGQIGIEDFLALLAQWGTVNTCDFDGGGVGITDFLELLANWGPCP